jgi:hypothetical protein
MKPATEKQMAKLRKIIITSEDGTCLTKKVMLKLLAESKNLTREVIFVFLGAKEIREGISYSFGNMKAGKTDINGKMKKMGTDLRFFNIRRECFALIHKDKTYPDESGVIGEAIKFTILLEPVVDLTLTDIKNVSLKL